MKSRFLAVLFAFILFLPLSAEAEISFDNDTPEKSTLIYSSIAKIDFFDQLLFKRFLLNGKDEYLLTFIKTSPKDWYLFSDNGSAIKIDGEITQLPTLDTSHEFKQGYSYSNLITTAMFDLTTLADQLKTAKSVTFRIYFENQPAVDLVVPDKVLAEWKQVIATEK